MDKVLEKEPRISVAGIAGPGDPFANAEETLATMRLIRQKYPETLLCLSSNGLKSGPAYTRTGRDRGLACHRHHQRGRPGYLPAYLWLGT